MSDAPRIFTPDEGAEVLKIVTAAWLKRHAANGDIPSVKIGRGRGFTAAQLGEIVLKFTEKPGAGRPSRAPAARSAGGASVTALQARTPRRKQATA